MCVFQQPMLFNRAPRFLFVATNAVSEERCCTQIRIKYSFWPRTIASSFLLSSEYLGKINFIKFCYLFFDTIVFNSFWTVKNHKFTPKSDFAALTVGKPTIFCDAPSPRQTKAFDAILRHVSPGTFILQISKRNENEYGEGKKKMKRSLAWIFKRLERKSNKIVFRFVKVNKVKWMDPSPFALSPPPYFFETARKKIAKI